MAVESTISEDIDIENMTDEQIEAMAAEMAEQELAAKKQRDMQLDLLANTIEAKFFHRAIRRRVKESEWRKSMELYLGNLSVDSFVSSDKPFTEARGSVKPYHNIVGNKCDIAIAQSVDMQFAGGEKNWSLGPAPNTKDPAEAQGAREMEREIQTQLERCAYGRKARRAIEDRVVIGTGILKGPVNTGKPYIKYEMDQATGMWLPVPATSTEPAIEWVNPWFYYPDDTVNDFNMVSDSLEVHPSSALDLKKLMNHSGFDSEAIAKALESAPKAYIANAYSDYTQITASNPYLFEDKYMLIEYHGPITKEMLDVMGAEPHYEAVDGEYYGEVWAVCGKVIRLELENIEAAFELPYALSTWKKDPSSVFGFGSPLLMKDAQRVAREVWRMILDNASLSSGPQVAMHSVYVEPVNGSWELAPNKAWRLLDSTVDVNKALQFFEVPNVTQQLMPILDRARQFGEEESMTPMLAGGLQGADAQESASGALMMKEASTTVLDFLSEDWDDNVTEKVIRRMYGWNMQYNEKQEIKGNYSIDVRTITEYKAAQMHLRDMERLSMEVSQNPEAAILVNQDELYRARFAAMRLPYAGIIKSPEEIQQAREAAAQQPNPQMIELQIKQKELELQEKKLNIDEQRMQFELHQQQQREQWDHEEKMSANYARTIEAEARVISTQNEKELGLIQLAAKMENDAERNKIMRDIAILNDSTKRFDAQMKSSAKARDQLLTLEELKAKKATGSGI